MVLTVDHGVVGGLVIWSAVVCAVALARRVVAVLQIVVLAVVLVGPAVILALVLIVVLTIVLAVVLAEVLAEVLAVVLAGTLVISLVLVLAGVLTVALAVVLVPNGIEARIEDRIGVGRALVLRGPVRVNGRIQGTAAPHAAGAIRHLVCAVACWVVAGRRLSAVVALGGDVGSRSHGRATLEAGLS